MFGIVSHHTKKELLEGISAAKFQSAISFKISSQKDMDTARNAINRRISGGKGVSLILLEENR